MLFLPVRNFLYTFFFFFLCLCFFILTDRTSRCFSLHFIQSSISSIWLFSVSVWWDHCFFFFFKPLFIHLKCHLDNMFFLLIILHQAQLRRPHCHPCSTPRWVVISTWLHSLSSVQISIWCLKRNRLPKVTVFCPVSCNIQPTCAGCRPSQGEYLPICLSVHQGIDLQMKLYNLSFLLENTEQCRMWINILRDMQNWIELLYMKIPMRRKHLHMDSK